MISTGYSFANKDRIYTQLICGCCGKDLGTHTVEDGKEYNDTEGWKFCPYCGNEIEIEQTVLK